MTDRHPISIRPTLAQRRWLEVERDRRGLALNALVVLALEAAMRAEQRTTGAREAP